MTLVLSKCRETSVISLVFANDADYAKPRLEGRVGHGRCRHRRGLVCEGRGRGEGRDQSQLLG